MVVEETRRLLVSAIKAEEIKAGGGFVKRDPTLLIVDHSTAEVISEIERIGKEGTKRFPVLGLIAGKSNQLAQLVPEAEDGHRLLEIYGSLMNLHQVRSDPEDNFVWRSDSDAVFMYAKIIGDDPDGVPAPALQADRDDQSMLAATANMIATTRRQGRALSRDEQAAVALAFRLLDRSVQLPSAYRSIGVYGFREHQTYLSLANPGEGHLAVTCLDRELLQGTVVHVEHIDRDGEKNRELIEPYRLPAAINAARVRLYAGAAAPCTAYIGRPVFENGVATRKCTSIYEPVNFERDLLKTVHLSASSCTSMFMNGIADCKIGIERMSTGQAIRFMRAVAGNVVRDPIRQYLSAAFNLNLPFWNDDPTANGLVADRIEIARLAIAVTKAGRFSKVTWDGASNRVPSEPIIDQLKFEEWVELVHAAHEQGLETYISAGLEPAHMRQCVFTGVDGVGIGTSLHHRDPVTGAIGQLKPEAIREVLRIRAAAASETLGRGASLLARWDRMYFEGTLPSAEEPIRQQLFRALKQRDESEVGKIVGRFKPRIEFIPSGHPLIEQARRILRTADLAPIGATRLGTQLWTAQVKRTGDLLARGDLAGLQELLS